VPRLTAIRKQALDEMMKEAFFDAAVAVLAEHGVEGMTMDRVASAASVAKGSLYHYFSSKQELLQFVYAKLTDPIFDDLTETVARKQTATEKVASHLHTLLEHVAKHARVFRLLFNDDTAHGLLQSSERRCHEVAGKLLAEIFTQGITEGIFRPADPLVLARMFLGICRGVFDGQPDLQESSQRENVHRLILGSFLHGVATENGRVC
jgi:TetR/AcrR family transcriptional regulator, cholesterol catabolism regulator